MGVKYKGIYTGNKGIELEHLDSGTKIRTAAPLDNNGDGSSFSPTDLCAASLGACMLTVIAIYAERKELPLTGSYFELEKNMASEPRRIGEIRVDLHLPSSLSDTDRKTFERVAETCPVHKSLSHETAINVNYIYDVL